MEAEEVVGVANGVVLFNATDWVVLQTGIDDAALITELDGVVWWSEVDAAGGVTVS